MSKWTQSQSVFHSLSLWSCVVYAIKAALLRSPFPRPLRAPPLTSHHAPQLHTTLGNVFLHPYPYPHEAHDARENSSNNRRRPTRHPRGGEGSHCGSRYQHRRRVHGRRRSAPARAHAPWDPAQHLLLPILQRRKQSRRTRPLFANRAPSAVQGGGPLPLPRRLGRGRGRQAGRRAP
ncbi:hypothetical protein B0H11DRAFT_2018852 [Mycena galericulata]|nr:hypothetical protein B0H11DRAFT_2018852 [Mycena galericulata]